VMTDNQVAKLARAMVVVLSVISLYLGVCPRFSI